MCPLLGARSPARTLYFNLRVHSPARNDKSIRRTPDHSVPPPAFAAAHVGQAVRLRHGQLFRHDYAALIDRSVRARSSRHARSLAKLVLVQSGAFYTDPGTKKLLRLSPFCNSLPIEAGAVEPEYFGLLWSQRKIY